MLSLLVYLGFVLFIILLDLFVLILIKYVGPKEPKNRFLRWLIKPLKKPNFRLYFTAFVSCFVLWAIFALKSVHVGSDTQSYVDMYNDVAKDTLFLNKTLSSTVKPHYEMGFLFFASLVAHTHLPYIFFQAIVYFIICSCLFYSSVKLSKNTMFSILIFFTFTFYNFFISGLRQSLAVALCLAALTIALTRKKNFVTYFFYFLIVAVASSMHNSAILFLPVIFLTKIRATQRSVLLMIFATAIFYVFGYQLFNLAIAVISSTNLVYIEGYVAYSGGVGKTPILMLIFTLFSFLCLYPNVITDWYIPFGLDSIGKYTNPLKNKKIENVDDSNNNIMIYMMFFGCCFEFLNRFSSGLGRGSIFFTIAIIFLLPNALESFENKRTKYILKMFFAIGFVAFLFYYSIMPDTMNFSYEFFF